MLDVDFLCFCIFILSPNFSLLCLFATHKCCCSGECSVFFSLALSVRVLWLLACYRFVWMVITLCHVWIRRDCIWSPCAIRSKMKWAWCSSTKPTGVYVKRVCAGKWLIVFDSRPNIFKHPKMLATQMLPAWECCCCSGMVLCCLLMVLRMFRIETG